MALILVLSNTSHLTPVSDYTYEVLVGDGTTLGSKRITSGTITGHRRDDGWQALVQRLLEHEKPATS